MSIDGQPIQGEDDLRLVLGEVRDDEAVVRVVRRGRPVEMTVQF